MVPRGVVRPRGSAGCSCWDAADGELVTPGIWATGAWASSTDSTTLVNDMGDCDPLGALCVRCSVRREPSCPGGREAQFNLGEFIVESLGLGGAW